MAVLADAAPCGPVPGRTCKRQWTVPLPAVQQAAAAVSACHAAVAGVHRAGRLRVAGVRRPRPRSHIWTADVRRLRQPGPEPRGVRGTGHRGSVRWTSGLPPGAGRTAALPRGHRRSPPEQGGGYGGASGRPSMHAPPATALDANRRIPCLWRQQNLDAGGCPDEGVRRPADTAAVSAVRPELRPPGDGVRTAGVHRGHRRRLRGGCCYRKRSPDRWPLVRCSHRR
jgi:hypothetical protein